MIKIGDFSKLAHVSIKTLHHYDEVGLLRPCHVDRFSGYRFYDLQQMATLNRILAFKDLGLSLEQIAQFIHDEISAAEMRGMLRLKRMELLARVEDEQARLARVETRLRQLEQGNMTSHAEVALKQVSAQTILLAHVVAASERLLPAARQSLHSLLQNYLGLAQLKPAGPWFSLMDDLPYVDTELKTSLGVAVQLRQGQNAGDWNGTPVVLQDLPAVPWMASVVHTDDPVGLPQSYAYLYAWTQSNGYQFAGPLREIYLPEAAETAAPASQLNTALIEIQCPVEKAAIPLSILSRKDKTMQPKFVTKPAFKAVGLAYVGKNQSPEIPQLWGQFNQRYAEPKAIDPGTAYGLCITDIPQAVNGDFEYVAALEVADDQNIPAGMVYREVPTHKYAVFTHHGDLKKLGETYHYIYNTWLPQSNCQVHPSKFDMEVYAGDFDPKSPDSEFDIYVAIQ